VGWTGRLAGATAIAAAAGAILLVRRASLRWGATDDELGMTLDGDDLLPNPDLTSTRAISIAAPRSAVWPWIAQLGQNRGGFYTYDWLENLAGVEIHSTDTIEPELQIRSVGDDVNLAPGSRCRLSTLRRSAISCCAVPSPLTVRAPEPPTTSHGRLSCSPDPTGRRGLSFASGTRTSPTGPRCSWSRSRW
jgi:hypothetical protein